MFHHHLVRICCIFCPTTDQANLGFLFFQGWILFLFGMRGMRCPHNIRASFFLTSSNPCWQTLHEGMCHKMWRIFVRCLLMATLLVDLLQLRKHLPQSNLQSLTNSISNVEPRMRAIGELQLKNKIPYLLSYLSVCQLLFCHLNLFNQIELFINPYQQRLPSLKLT